jgi:hypothetical protein
LIVPKGMHGYSLFTALACSSRFSRPSWGRRGASLDLPGPLVPSQTRTCFFPCYGRLPPPFIMLRSRWHTISAQPRLGEQVIMGGDNEDTRQATGVDMLRSQKRA